MMVAKIAEGVSGKAGERAAALVFTPGFAFWAAGPLLFVLGDGGVKEIEDWLEALTTSMQIALLIGAFLLVAGSTAVIQRLSMPALRLVEGYSRLWPPPVRRLARRWQVWRAGCIEQRWQALAAKQPTSLSAEDRLDYVRFDERLRRAPDDAADFLPTKLGNILRASELRVQAKYGLEPSLMWPRLFLILPAAARAEIVAARGALNDCVALMTWGLLFFVWTPLHWSAPLIAVVVAAGGWVGAQLSAAIYGDLVESAFDLHRTALYAALRRRPPESPHSERACGQALTVELMRGGTETSPAYTTTPPPAEADQKVPTE